MALRRALAKRLSPAGTSENSRFSSRLTETIVHTDAAKAISHQKFSTLPDSSLTGYFRRFLHHRAIVQPSRLPAFFDFHADDKLKDKINCVNVTGNRLQLGGLGLPAKRGDKLAGLSALDVKKILRFAMAEKLKTELRKIPKNSVTYSEFVQMCSQVCESENQGLEFAKLLDEAGDVVVLGNVVLLRPEQVAQSIQTLISHSVAPPDDPRREELERMEKEKAIIDEKAMAQVRGEFYCGMGFLVAQTLGFMRLTFWELSWDVMEPICFFVASFHFFVAYGFFLRTSKEPTFEGVFQRRFKTKQKHLMQLHNFDMERYDALRKAFYRNSNQLSYFKNEERGALMR